jgi:hypothetical protein
MIKWQYAELLAEIGVKIPETEIEKPPEPELIMRYECCNKQAIEVGAWNKDGMFVCWECGKVIEEQMFVFEENPEYGGDGKPLGSKSQYGPVPKRRIYKRLTHFKEHIRRYVGARFTAIPEDLITKLKTFNIDLEDKNCYTVIKTALKKLKYPKLYKEIFTIIYLLGGKRPKIEPLIPKLYEQYKAFDFYYEQIREELNRKNGISFYMVLDMMLKELDHSPFYNLPYLKDPELQDKVLEIFTRIRQEQKDDATKFSKISRKYRD